MYQQVTIVGRLGADPEMRYTANGKAVTSFSVATDSGYGERKTTEWFRCIAWEKTAEAVAQYVRKGSLVMAVGRMQTRSWEDQQGQKRSTTELIADRVQFLDSKADRPGLDPEPQGDIDPDDLPF